MFEWQWCVIFSILVLANQNFITSIFLHRIITHRAAKLTSTSLSTFCRIWLWLFGFTYPNHIRYWAAMHRKHHADSDSVNDPHSPQFFNFKDLVIKIGGTPGKSYYVKHEDTERYSKDLPYYTDWFENNIVKRFRYPIVIVMIIYFILFGIWGILFSIIVSFIAFRQLLLMGYLTHYKGYRNKPAVDLDRSVNIFPIGVFFGGEELGANHHDNPGSPKFSTKWWEFDIGWSIILVLRYFGLVKLHTDK